MAKRKDGSCFIGTSGWYYAHWKGVFYTKDLTESDFLPFYSKHFNIVEINNSFYKLPEKEVFAKWRSSVGDDFLFAVKGNRYITHLKKLKDADLSVPNLFDAISGLGNKLGPVLFQLPPMWHKNTDRLNDFVKQLPPECRCAIEFRDKTWFDEDVYVILSKHNIAFCVYDLAGQTSPQIVTADFVYVRLHGPANNAYKGSYPRQQLDHWADKFRHWMKEGKDIYCFFDNDQRGYAVQNAINLKKIIDS